MKWTVGFCCVLLTLSCRAETSGTGTGTSTTPDKAEGPLVELTPNEGAVFTAVLLTMKDGMLEFQVPPFSEIRQEKTTEFKSVRFVPPPAPTPPPPQKTTATATGTGTGTGTGTSTAHELNPAEKKKEEHKRFMELMKKWRTTKLTPAEQTELNELPDKLPMLRAVGGLVFIKQMMNAEEDTKAAAASGKLNDYITKARGNLKDSTLELEVRVQVLRLAYAYRQQNLTLVNMIEQLEKDISAIAKVPLRNTAHDKLQNFMDLWFMLNGERAPKL